MQADVSEMGVSFGTNSSNDRAELWVKSAVLLAPQLLQLQLLGAPCTVESIDAAHTALGSAAVLKAAFDRHGSDKASVHDYYKLYAALLEPYLGSASAGGARPRILEIGIGTNNPDLVSSMGANGRPGASARAFRDHVSRADVFAADIDTDILFEEDRIRTAFVDQLDAPSFETMHAAFGGEDYDLIIDDGLHSIGANLNTLLFGIGHVRPGGHVVIEDIRDGTLPLWAVVDTLLARRPDLETRILKAGSGSFLYVVRRAAEAL